MTDPTLKFGLLKYSTFNLGDQIQSIAAQQFLPRVDQFIDRERLDEFVAGDGEKLKLVMNGWYCHRPDKWPPAACLEPLLISMHVSDYPGEGSGLRASEHFPRSPRTIDFLRRHGPVGARDLNTLELLSAWGIESYFSGCLTLTLKRTNVTRREDLVVLCDTPEAVAAFVAETPGIRVLQTAHRDETTVEAETRMARARELLGLYSAARCVVTTRLHCALPCLAIGTPVLLLDVAPDRYRFSGLIDLVHHCSAEHFLAGDADYSVASPPPNPTRHLLLREALARRVHAFVGHEPLDGMEAPSIG